MPALRKAAVFLFEPGGKRKWSVGILVAVVAAGALGYFIWVRTDATLAQVRRTSPDNLKAYRLKPEDRSVLQRFYAMRQANDSTALLQWAYARRCRLLRTGLCLMEQGMLLHWRTQHALGQAKLDTAFALGRLLATSAQDSFLWRQSKYVKNLSGEALQARVKTSEAFAVAREFFVPASFSKAAKWLEYTRTLARMAHDDKFLIDASYLLQYALQRQGRYQAVVALADEIEQFVRRSNYWLCLAAALAEAADAHSHLGRNDAALAILSRAADFAESIDDSIGLARCHFSRAFLNTHVGDYAEAERSIAHVLRFDASGKYRGQVLSLHAQIAGLKSEYGRAEEFYLKALEIYEENLESGNQIQTCIELSKLKTLTGDYQSALVWAQRAHQLGLRLGENPRVAETLGQLGWVYVQTDSLSQAIAALRQAALESPNVASANIEITLGKAYLKQGDFEAARSTFLQAEKTATDGDVKIILVESRLGLGEVALAEGRAMEAQAWLTSALDLAQRVQEASLVAEALFGIAATHRKLKDFSAALRTLDRAFAIGETLRVTLRHDSARVSYFSKLQDGFDAAICAALAVRDPQLALHYAERARARAMRDAFTESSQANATHNDTLQNWFDIPPVPELQKGIPAHVQVLEYRVTSDTLLLWLLEKEKFHMRRIAITARALDDTIARFLSSVGARDYEDFLQRADHDCVQVYNDNRRLGRELFNILLQPIVGDLDAEKLLYLIPDGTLHLLPWGALVDEKERFFDETHAWVKAPSLEILTRASESHAHQALGHENRLLMVANNLPSLVSQKRVLGKMFANFSLLQNTDATFGRVQEALAAGVDIAYFSVRAVANMKQPLNSFMELAEDNPPGPGRVRKVYARELQAWNFSNAGLIILNACETASGKIERGEGGMSMARFFTRARIPHVLASLWKNDDRVSAKIMNELLAGMNNDQEMAMSLQQAKRNCIRQLKQKYQYPLPYFWATFELHETSFSCSNPKLYN